MTTDERRAEVARLRAMGWSSGKIAAALGVSRQGVFYLLKPLRSEKRCKKCGKSFPYDKVKRATAFCSDACRPAWGKQKNLLDSTGSI